MVSADECYVCGYGPHEPTTLHTYWPTAEAEAWFRTLPDSPHVINGASLDAEAGLPLGTTLVTE